MSNTMRHTLFGLAALGLYFAVPVRTGVDMWARVVVTLGIFVVLAALMVRQARADDSRISSLVYLLVGAVAASVLAAYALAVQVPGQFEGIATRIDALYFTLVTMTTVGFGDAHAVGQQAKVLVIAMLVFNLVFVARLAQEIIERLSRRRQGEKK